MIRNYPSYNANDLEIVDSTWMEIFSRLNMNLTRTFDNLLKRGWVIKRNRYGRGIIGRGQSQSFSETSANITESLLSPQNRIQFT